MTEKKFEQSLVTDEQHDLLVEATKAAVVNFDSRALGLVVVRRTDKYTSNRWGRWMDDPSYSVRSGLGDLELISMAEQKTPPGAAIQTNGKLITAIDFQLKKRGAYLAVSGATCNNEDAYYIASTTQPKNKLGVHARNILIAREYSYVEGNKRDFEFHGREIKSEIERAAMGNVRYVQDNRITGYPLRVVEGLQISAYDKVVEENLLAMVNYPEQLEFSKITSYLSCYVGRGVIGNSRDGVNLSDIKQLKTVEQARALVIKALDYMDAQKFY